MRRLVIAAAVAVAFTSAPLAVHASPGDTSSGLAVSPVVTIARQEQDIASLRAALEQVTQQRDQANQKVSDLQSQVNALQSQLSAYGAGVGAGPVLGVSGGGGGGAANRFVPGQCTWYVASRRYVPWMGNANQWPYAAAAMGFSEGSTPRAGAIMVSADSYFGHVSYVETVAMPFWTVSEMNWVAPFVTDTRTVTYATAHLVTFIY